MSRERIRSWTEVRRVLYSSTGNGMSLCSSITLLLSELRHDFAGEGPEGLQGVGERMVKIMCWVPTSVWPRTQSLMVSMSPTTAPLLRAFICSGMVLESRSMYMAQSSIFSGGMKAPLADFTISAGLRPTCRQCSLRTRYLWATDSAPPWTFIMSAHLATTRRVRFSPPPAIRIGGWGCWTGWGLNGASVKE